jgi:hypothetical protein
MAASLAGPLEILARYPVLPKDYEFLAIMK